MKPNFRRAVRLRKCGGKVMAAAYPVEGYERERLAREALEPDEAARQQTFRIRFLTIKWHEKYHPNCQCDICTDKD